MPSFSLDQVNAALEHTIPVAHSMGVRFVELEPGRVAARVPFEGNGNHFGVVYAGVIVTVAEVLGGGLTFSTFDATTHYPLVKRLEVDFLAPGRTDLTAMATLDDTEIARVRGEAVNGKAQFDLAAEVTGTDGTVVARTVGIYQIRPL